MQFLCIVEFSEVPTGLKSPLITRAPRIHRNSGIPHPIFTPANLNRMMAGHVWYPTDSPIANRLGLWSSLKQQRQTLTVYSKCMCLLAMSGRCRVPTTWKRKAPLCRWWYHKHPGSYKPPHVIGSLRTQTTVTRYIDVTLALWRFKSSTVC